MIVRMSRRMIGEGGGRRRFLLHTRKDMDCLCFIARTRYFESKQHDGSLSAKGDELDQDVTPVSCVPQYFIGEYRCTAALP